MRTFPSGATRNNDEGKIDYEGFLSPLALTAYGRYLHKNRFLENGSLRASDNWQKGVPQSTYMKSMWRHFMDVWRHHRGYPTDGSMNDALCAIIFNAQGMLHERLKIKLAVEGYKPQQPWVNWAKDWRNPYSAIAQTNQKLQSLEERRRQEYHRTNFASSPQPEVYPGDW